MKHVKDQNWIAVLLDFFIVVLGVFIGAQVGRVYKEQLNSIGKKIGFALSE